VSRNPTNHEDDRRQVARWTAAQAVAPEPKGIAPKLHTEGVASSARARTRPVSLLLGLDVGTDFDQSASYDRVVDDEHHGARDEHHGREAAPTPLCRSACASGSPDLYVVGVPKALRGGSRLPAARLPPNRATVPGAIPPARSPR